LSLGILFEALGFGLAVALIMVGIAGVVVPILPGLLLVWLTVLAYAIVEGFASVDPLTFSAITLIALITGTANFWLAFLGSRKGGATAATMIYGLAGGLLGFLLLSAVAPLIGSLFGGILGYSAGILLGQYQKQRNWKLALRASLGGLAGWGIATFIELGGSVLILTLFVWQVLRG
jgi:uncharacterized protein YqgC (DUF456 family)